ncbi:MAG: hypothetical protein KQH63_20365 [Desulfobulbaceae bacterium]|nr:hypothetical protein [Desulfobulbaceae bacterium]
MECERLNRLVRAWYVQVQEETLAPARMVEFMEKHLENCDDCLADPDVLFEVKKITEIVLPPSKMVKTGKTADEDGEAAPDPEDSDDSDESDDESDDEDDEIEPDPDDDDL